MLCDLLIALSGYAFVGTTATRIILYHSSYSCIPLLVKYYSIALLSILLVPMKKEAPHLRATSKVISMPRGDHLGIDRGTSRHAVAMRAHLHYRKIRTRGGARIFQKDADFGKSKRTATKPEKKRETEENLNFANYDEMVSQRLEYIEPRSFARFNVLKVVERMTAGWKCMTI